MTSKKAVMGLFSTRAAVQVAIGELKDEGFGTNDMSALLADQGGTRGFALQEHTKAPEGAVAGGGAGGAIGATLGLLAGLGVLAIPGVGPFLAAGPILAAMSGAAAGAAVGGLAGALVGMGIPEFEAKQYEGKLKSGNILLSVHVDDGNERTRAKEILQRCGAADIVTAGEASVPAKQRADRHA